MTDTTDTSDNGETELAELRALARRAGTEPEQWESPPDDLWDRIAAGVELSAPVSGSVPLSFEPASDAIASVQSIVPGGRSRRRSAPWLLAAAAAVIVIGALGVFTIAQSRSDDETVVASTKLEPLGQAGSGRAKLVDNRGSLQLRIETSGLDAGDGFLEVWVIDPAVSKLVSLGPLRADGVYDLPPGLDPATFPIVDVSIEPIDGNPTHSGDSVLRGQLTF